MKRLVLILMALTLAACGGVRRATDLGGGGGHSVVGLLSSREQAHAAMGEGALAFDLRSPSDWSRGRLPGARNIALDELRAGRGLPDDLDALILFYGTGPLDRTAEDAAELAASRGYRRVLYFTGGFEAWQGAK
ncbi:MAG: rhodanese-like domain-containing protein [Planctomycetaceae bacterium]|nr:hypothetical protein [Planctomycetota bacterium]NUO16698.1 rhodanese-like domain-containing protein [Planctomycetaceae bacterium]GIK52811.1 MAG: hypothetical protein BroJett014_17840 [Planctomycetota bacterium]